MHRTLSRSPLIGPISLARDTHVPKDTHNSNPLPQKHAHPQGRSQPPQRQRAQPLRTTARAHFYSDPPTRARISAGPSSPQLPMRAYTYANVRTPAHPPTHPHIHPLTGAESNTSSAARTATAPNSTGTQHHRHISTVTLPHVPASLLSRLHSPLSGRSSGKRKTGGGGGGGGGEGGKGAVSPLSNRSPSPPHSPMSGQSAHTQTQKHDKEPVSYTHLTLPTICSV